MRALHTLRTPCTLNTPHTVSPHSEASYYDVRRTAPCKVLVPVGSAVALLAAHVQVPKEHLLEAITRGLRVRVLGIDRLVLSFFKPFPLGGQGSLTLDCSGGGN